jgi:ribosomal protein S18 acetylase RimI-like enzyme
MTMTIRNALAQEFHELAALNIEAYREYSNALTSDNWQIMQASLSNVAKLAEQGQSIVAQHEHRLVGAVVYCPPGTSDSRLFQPEWASLRLLSVLPQYRGQGIGPQLCLKCIHQAKQDNASVIGLHTSELMIAARRMYEKLGFRQDIELPQHFGLQYWRYVLTLSGNDEI